MANYCDYSMCIQGPAPNVEEVIKSVKAHYDYDNMKFDHKSHLTRVFESDIMEDITTKGIRKVVIDGYCAWSVYSCMLSGLNTYYNSLKEEYGDESRATTLEELSREHNVAIEVYGSEQGDGFQEHYAFIHGEMYIDEVTDFEALYEDGYDDKEEFQESLNELKERYGEEGRKIGDDICFGGFPNWDFAPYEYI